MNKTNPRKRATELLRERDWIWVVATYLLLTTVLSQVVALATPSTLGEIASRAVMGDVVGMQSALAQSGATLSIFLSVFMLLFSATMLFGLHYWALGMARGHTMGVSALLEGFSSVGKVVRVSLLELLYTVGWLMLLSMCCSFPLTMLSFVLFELPDGIFLMIGSLVMGLFSLMAIAVSFRYIMIGFLFFDDEKLGAYANIRTSVKMMRGRYGELFKLYLSFWPYYVLTMVLYALAWIVVNFTLILSLFQGVSLDVFIESTYQLSSGTTMTVLGFLIDIAVAFFLLPKRMVALATFYDEVKIG